VQELEHQLDDRRRQLSKRLSVNEERLLKELANDLPMLWTHKLVADRDRKALLRAAMDEVQIVKRPPQHVELKVIWKGGAVGNLSIELPRTPSPSSMPTDLVDLVRTLATKYDDAQIARVLARRRIKTPKKQLPFTAHRIADLRRKYEIPRCPDRARDEGATTYTVEQAAKVLGVSAPTIYAWLKLGLLHGEQITRSAPWSIEITDAERRRLIAAAPPGWLSLEQAAAEFGVSNQTILNWVKARKVDFVYVTKGRRRGLRIDIISAPYRTQQRLVD
jgi:transposase